MVRCRAGLKDKPVPRLHPLACIVGVGVCAAAFAPGVSIAQQAATTAGQAASGNDDSNWPSRSRPAGNAASRFAQRPGVDNQPIRFDVPSYGNPPAFGAGNSGYDSTNARRKKARGAARPRQAGAANPPLAPATTSATPHQAPQQQLRSDAHADPAATGSLATPPAALLHRRPPPPEEDPFEPLGVRAGGFVLRPAIEVTGGHDSNPAHVPNSGSSSLLVVAPELQARSDWERHALNADIRGTYTAYSEHFVPSLDRPYVDGRINGRIDVIGQSHADVEGRLLVSTDNPGSPNIQAGLAKLPIFTTVGGSLGYTQNFNRLDVTLKGGIDRTSYQDSTLTDGSTASNDDRDYNQYAGLLRGSYEVTPGVKPFVEAGVDTRVHDLPIDRTGMQRDSDGVLARAGTTFELTRKLTGEISAGYMNRHYRDPALPDLGGAIFDASLLWTASALTKVLLTARSSADETILPGVSGAFRRDFAVQVDHAFRRWLIGTFKAGIGLDDYIGSTRDDRRYFVSTALVYKLSRDLQLKGELRRDWLRSTAAGVDYTADSALIGIRLQR